MPVRVQRRGRAPIVRVGVAAAVLSLSGCGDANTATDEERVSIGTGVVTAAEGAGLVLPTAGVRCVGERVTDEAVAEVIEVEAVDWTDATGATVASALVECVGSVELMAAELTALQPELSPPSVVCVSERLDPDVVEQVIDAALRQRPRNGPEVEVELGVALGLCLDTDELLDL